VALRAIEEAPCATEKAQSANEETPDPKKLRQSNRNGARAKEMAPEPKKWRQSHRNGARATEMAPEPLILILIQILCLLSEVFKYCHF